MLLNSKKTEHSFSKHISYILDAYTTLHSETKIYNF